MPFVAMEQIQCPVCGKVEDTGSILIDRKLREDLFKEHGHVTHWDLCKEHKAKYDEGYIALVGIVDDETGETRRLPSEVRRTGLVAHVNARVWDQVFNIPLPVQEKIDGSDVMLPICYVPDDVLHVLARIAKDAEKAGATEH